MSDGGKGSDRRTQQISDDEMQARWDLIFNKKKQTPEEERIDIIGQNGNDGEHYGM
jgi:hypothetical protein